MTETSKTTRTDEVLDQMLDRMDPRQRRTREAIVRAGQTLFAERHPEDVSTDDLIRAAEISKQSFYNHFADKDALAREIMRVGRFEMEGRVENANHGEDDPARRVANGLCVYASLALTEPAQAKLLIRVVLQDLDIHSDVNAHIVEDMRQGLKRGRLSMMTLEAGTAFTIGAGAALSSRLLVAGKGELAVILSQQMVALTLRAFGLDFVESERIASEAAERIVRPASLS